jgi:hypothetical protein
MPQQELDAGGVLPDVAILTSAVYANPEPKVLNEKASFDDVKGSDSSDIEKGRGALAPDDDDIVDAKGVCSRVFAVKPVV